MLSTSILYLVLFSVVLCQANPSYESQPPVQVLQYQLDHSKLPNSYNFHYDTSDGSSRTEQGAILNPGTEQAALDVFGKVRWYENGHLYEMTYKAGKRGYRTVIRILT